MNVNTTLEASAQRAEGWEPRVRALDAPAVAIKPIWVWLAEARKLAAE